MTQIVMDKKHKPRQVHYSCQAQEKYQAVGHRSRLFRVYTTTWNVTAGNASQDGLKLVGTDTGRPVNSRRAWDTCQRHLESEGNKNDEPEHQEMPLPVS